MKTWKIICKGKTISKHLDFYHAQEGVERHLKSGKIDNTYEIVPIKYDSRKEYEQDIKSVKIKDDIGEIIKKYIPRYITKE